MKVLAPIDENQDAVTKEWVEGKGYTTNIGTIIGVSVDGTSIATSGVANISEIPSNVIIPASTKTYTDIIGDASSNTLANNAFFFGSVRPDSFTEGWSVTYRVHIWVPSNSNFDAVSEVHFFGDQASINSYAIFNHIYSTSYRPAYYHTVAKLTSTGYTAGYGHALAVNLADSNSRGDSNLTRTLVVEVLEQNNCTVTLNDTAVKWATWPGTGSTNYADPTNYNFSANGLQETGDNDNIYQQRSGYTRILGPSTGDSTTTKSLYRYQLVIEDKDGLLIPFNFVSNKATTYTKDMSTASFNPFSGIYYYNSTTTVAVGSSIAANTLYEQILADIRYSMNINSSGTAGSTALTTGKPVYIKALYDYSTATATFVQDVSDANYLIRSSIVQDLPTTNPNTGLTTGTEYIYIQLGNAYSKYQVELLSEHKLVWHWDSTNNTCAIFSGSTAQGTSIENAWYCTCSTAASTADKILTCSDNAFMLKIGTIISVEFEYSNSASLVTFNVNSTGALSIGNRGSQYTGTDPEITGYEGRLLYYVYDGTYWSWLNVFAEEDNSAGSYIPIGTMTMFAGSTPPEGWLICDGSAISRTTYASLFNKIGTTYGAGDGSTTFNIPNFKGRVPVGLDTTQTEFDTLGETGGEKYHTLVASELPSQPNYWGYAGENTDWPIVSNLGLGTQTNCEHYVNVGGTMGSGTTSVYTIRSSGANNPTMHDQGHLNLQPYGVTNIIIRALNTVAEEAPVDSLPIGSILEYDGNTVPEGYSQVEDEMIILYSDTTGSNTSVTLSDSLANYTYAEIIYRSNDGEDYKNSTGKIWNPNGNHVTMTYWFLLGHLYLKYSNAYLDRTSITLTDSSEMYWDFSTNTFVHNNANNIYIVQVIGYR